jgi:hypothetical protein
MTREEALKIIREEDLRHYNICEQRPYREMELVIQFRDGKWFVYGTGERASVITGSEAIFISESDAWDNFIKRLRAGKRLEQRTNGKYH